MSKLRVVLPCLLLASSLAARSQAPPDVGRIGVSPARVELTLGARPATESVRVLNYGSRPVEIRVRVQSWDLDEDNRVRILEPTEQSLDQWMVINPLRFTIEPGGSQAVRFSIRPRVEPEPGEHRAIIYFEQAGSPAQEASPSTFRTVFRLGVAVYGQAGEAVRTGRLHGIEVDGEAAWLDVSSEGTAHARLDGQYAIWPASAYPGSERTRAAERTEGNDLSVPAAVLQAGHLPTTPILPGTRRRVRVQLPTGLPPGDYVLDINATLAGEPIDRGLPFSVAGDDPMEGDRQAPAPPAG